MFAFYGANHYICILTKKKPRLMEIWIIWLLAAATLIGVEVLTQMVWTLCLAIGCLASTLSALLGADVALQISIAGVVSVIAYLALKPWFEKWQKKAADRNRHAARTGMDALLGRRGTVTDEIKPGKMGRIRIDGDNWQALAPDCDETIRRGQEVVVNAYDSIILTVRPVLS